MGVGLAIVGVERLGFQVSLGDHGAGQWIAVFYEGHGGHEPVTAAGTAQASTPWGAVQPIDAPADRAGWVVELDAGGRRSARRWASSSSSPAPELRLLHR